MHSKLRTAAFLSALIVGCSATLLSTSLLADGHKKDSTEQPDSLPSIASFTEGMAVQNGLLDIAYDPNSGSVYLVIPKTSEQFIYQSSLPRGVGSNDIGLDRGQLGDTALVRFDILGNKVLLNQINTEFRASSPNAAERASVDEAFADSVLAGFTVLADNATHVLIDYTHYLLSDVHGVSQRLARTNQGSFSVDKARSAVFPARTKSFQDNSELEAVVTFSGSNAGQYVRQVTPSPDSITVHLHHSFIRLPDDNYVPRAFHPMSGFWEHSYYDYSSKITDNIEKQVIVRHRLNKKDPSAERSEAVEAIVYYLDPGIPEPVMSALKEGALWWDEAFRAIGYDNAFQVKVLPQDADPMDVRYNVIQWVHRATRGWSYGSSVVDPRTGELIKGHVTLGSLRVRQDYLIALGLTSPFAEENADTSTQAQMALNRIKQLSAHEVGHTLGIAHNFAASENNRASVMDYPHPLIKVTNGQLDLSDAYSSGMGEWDIHSVAYGYQDYTSATQEEQGLNAIIESVLTAGLKYKSDPDSRVPRHATTDGHLWDNGSDPIEEFDHLANVRRIALENMGLNTIETGANLSSLAYRLVPIYLLHRYQLDAVAKQIGGIEYTYEKKRANSPAQGVTVVNAEKQKAALDRLIQASTADFLRMPEQVIKLLPPKAYGDQASREDFASRTGRVFDPIGAAEAAAFHTLSLVLHPERMNRLASQQASNSALPSPYNAARAILNQHWYNTTYSNDALKLRLQQAALQSVIQALQRDNLGLDVHLQLASTLVEFESWLANEASAKGYPKAWLTVLQRQFAQYAQTAEWPIKYVPPAMPPGSPI